MSLSSWAATVAVTLFQHFFPPILKQDKQLEKHAEQCPPGISRENIKIWGWASEPDWSEQFLSSVERVAWSGERGRLQHHGEGS